VARHANTHSFFCAKKKDTPEGVLKEGSTFCLATGSISPCPRPESVPFNPGLVNRFPQMKRNVRAIKHGNPVSFRHAVF
jgi:hypothetical protein